MSIETFKSLLTAFGDGIGLPGLEPDEEGYVALGFDDLPVHLQYEADEDVVVAFCKIGTIDEDRREGILAWLLGANLFWQATRGATIAIDPVEDSVFVQQRLELERTEAARFEGWLGTFVDVAEHWKGRLAAVNAGEPIDADTTPGPTAGDADIQILV
jgi:hypothetical protein